MRFSNCNHIDETTANNRLQLAESCTKFELSFGRPLATSH